MSKNGKDRRDAERFGSPFGKPRYVTRSNWDYTWDEARDLIPEPGVRVEVPMPKKSDDEATLDARAFKIVEPGYQLVARVLREKLAELNALLALAHVAGLEVEVTGSRGLDAGSEGMLTLQEFSRVMFGGPMFTPDERETRRCPQIAMEITRRERL